MPTITYPIIPDLPGVPAIPRSAAVPTGLNITLGIAETLLDVAQGSQYQWGIFDASGNQLGSGLNVDTGFLQTLASTVGLAPLLSTNAFEYTKESNISDFPVEDGGFATYNKVIMPSTPTVTLAFTGAQTDRTQFLAQVDAAAISTALYTVVTPEKTYYNYNILRYRMLRRQDRGANLLVLEIDLKEIRQVSAAYSTVAPTPINQPQNPAATPVTNSGLVQPQQPPPSVLKQLFGGN